MATSTQVLSTVLYGNWHDYLVSVINAVRGWLADKIRCSDQKF